MAVRIAYANSAQDDLDSIYDWVDEAADPHIALRYVERIQAACGKLALFPKRGTLRDEFGAGLRSVAFERSATIFYRIEGDVVRIVHVLHRGRDLGRAFVKE